jgi:hypothetical protein
MGSVETRKLRVELLAVAVEAALHGFDLMKRYDELTRLACDSLTVFMADPDILSHHQVMLEKYGREQTQMTFQSFFHVLRWVDGGHRTYVVTDELRGELEEMPWSDPPTDQFKEAISHVTPLYLEFESSPFELRRGTHSKQPWVGAFVAQTREVDEWDCLHVMLVCDSGGVIFNDYDDNLFTFQIPLYVGFSLRDTLRLYEKLKRPKAQQLNLGDDLWHQAHDQAIPLITTILDRLSRGELESHDEAAPIAELEARLETKRSPKKRRKIKDQISLFSSLDRVVLERLFSIPVSLEDGVHRYAALSHSQSH